MYPNSVPAPDAAENAALPTAGLQLSTTTASPRRLLATTFTEPPPPRSLLFPLLLFSRFDHVSLREGPSHLSLDSCSFSTRMHSEVPALPRTRLLTCYNYHCEYLVSAVKYHSQLVAPFAALLIHSLSASRLCPDSFNRIVCTRFR